MNNKCLPTTNDPFALSYAKGLTRAIEPFAPLRANGICPAAFTLDGYRQ